MRQCPHWLHIRAQNTRHRPWTGAAKPRCRDCIRLPAPQDLGKSERKWFPSELFHAEVTRKKDLSGPTEGSGSVFSTSNRNISPPLGRNTHSVRAAWPFAKHVREQMFQAQGTARGPDALEGSGRTGPLAGWLPAASRAYFLVQRNESGLLLASPGPARCPPRRSLRPAQAWCQKPQNVSWVEGARTRVTGSVPH